MRLLPWWRAKINRPSSIAANYAYSQLQEQFKDLGGLNDYCIKRIAFVLKDQFSIERFKLSINPWSEPKTIYVHVFAANGEEIGVRLSDAEIFNKLKEFLGTENYLVYFANEGKNESFGTCSTTKQSRAKRRGTT